MEFTTGVVTFWGAAGFGPASFSPVGAAVADVGRAAVEHAADVPQVGEAIRAAVGLG